MEHDPQVHGLNVRPHKLVEAIRCSLPNVCAPSLGVVEASRENTLQSAGQRSLGAIGLAGRMRPYDEVPEDEGPSSVFKGFVQGEGYEGIRPGFWGTLRHCEGP